MTQFAKHGLILVISALLAGLAGTWLSAELTFSDVQTVGLDPFWGRFQILFIVAVLVERSVESYLNATGQNGKERVDPATLTVVKISDASKPAMIAALVLSGLVALSGVRIIDSLVTLSANATLLQKAVWNGVDIIVSAGLMAGGSDLFHQLAELITTGLGRIRGNLNPAAPTNLRSGVPEAIAPFAYQYALPSTGLPESTVRAYTIAIERPNGAGAEEGTLRFSDGGVNIATQCWWDKGNRIDAGTYQRCSKTHMAGSRYEAIYLPDAVSKVSGEKSIFIHHGTSPLNSLGCFAVTPADFSTMWAHIKPNNGMNITVVIRDV
jgi:hypothetical protein